MIRNDIEQKLKDKDKDKLFLQHRNGIDQANYRVGLIDNEIIVWNPKPDIFMDYFYDDSNEDLFELSLLDNRLSGYFINRKGEVIGPRMKLKVLLNNDDYPYYNFRNHNYTVHRLISLLFIPNYFIDEKKYIDHIDQNKNNYSINNLRWVSTKENNRNRKQFEKFKNDNLVFRAYSDKELQNLIIELIGEKSVIDKYNNESIISIRSSIRNNTTYAGYFWEIEDLELTDYLKKFGINSIKDLDNTKWIEHYSGGFYVHPIGLIKTRRNKITVGSISNPNNRKNLHKERLYSPLNDDNSKHKLRVHRLVAEVFLNDNKPIEDKLVVDHINANPLDNRVENLRICTQKENMQNENTIKKLIENPTFTKKVIGPDGTIYDKVRDAAKSIGITSSSMWRKLNGKRPSNGFMYYKENDQDNNNNS